MAILDSSREQDILDRILAKVQNPEYIESIRSVYNEILKASRISGRFIACDSQSGPARYGLVGEKLSIASHQGFIPFCLKS